MSSKRTRMFNGQADRKRWKRWYWASIGRYWSILREWTSLLIKVRETSDKLQVIYKCIHQGNYLRSHRIQGWPSNTMAKHHLCNIVVTYRYSLNQMGVTVWEMVMVCSSWDQVTPATPVQGMSRVPDGVRPEEGELACWCNSVLQAMKSCLSCTISQPYHYSHTFIQKAQIF